VYIFPKLFWYTIAAEEEDDNNNEYNLAFLAHVYALAPSTIPSQSQVLAPLTVGIIPALTHRFVSSYFGG
jgi:hypothetical protein